MKYRSRTDIVAQILEAANGGLTRTKIMYRAYLTHQQLKDYLKMLVENDLLDYDSKTQTFKPTAKGIRFLNFYDSMGLTISRKSETREMPFFS